jgi:hypothetical protein
MENQKFFSLTRVERVIAKWSIQADTIEEAVALWNGDGPRTSDYVHYESEEVTDVYEATWRDPDDNDVTDQAYDLEQTALGPYACQNCEWRGEAGSLLDIKDLEQRVAPGEPMPAGECPKCGCLCHLVGSNADA